MTNQKSCHEVLLPVLFFGSLYIEFLVINEVIAHQPKQTVTGDILTD